MTTSSPTEPETSADQSTSFEGLVADLSTEERKRQAIDWAFDYRGDITLQLRSGETKTGYIFNRNDEVGAPYLEMMFADRPDPESIPYEEIVGLVFSGRDTAAGKSWQAWLNKVAAAEADGTIAEMYPESGSDAAAPTTNPAPTTTKDLPDGGDGV